MRDLSRCLRGPQLFLPMEIAFVMLLATAGTVLSCTLFRCCCRTFCAPAPVPPSEIHLDQTGELSEEEEDLPAQPAAANANAAASTTSVPPKRGGAHATEAVAAQEEEDEDDDDLPAYTQVAES